MQKTSLPDVSNKDVQIRMLVSPVTSFDVDTVCEGCGIVISRFMDVILLVSHSLPVAGSEGVGLVEKVGEGVTEVNPKDTVMLIKPFQGKSETME